ncbi:MAG: hypothetical protein IPN18_18455 [Ignavibacteriales bacterium]|nr:hypothetical protein [Ignavibacteriales bacterium]
MERVGPMIVVSIVYFWLFINFKNNTILPLVFAAVMLGSSVSVLAAFSSTISQRSACIVLVWCYGCFPVFIEIQIAIRKYDH